MQGVTPMITRIKQFLTRLIGSEKYRLDVNQKKEIERYIVEEQKNAESVILITGLFVSLFEFIIIIINGFLFSGTMIKVPFYAGTNHESFMLSLFIYSLFPIYFLIIGFIQKKGLYFASIKYITPSILISIITIYLLLYSSYAGWLFTLFCSAVTNYFLIIMLMGLYQDPKVSFYTVTLVVIEYLALILYASSTYKLLTVSILSHTLLSMLCYFFIMNYIPVLFFCGIITTLITKRMYVVLARALFFESEAIKKERERKAIAVSSRQKIDFFLSLAHDVKTPLTIIGNYLDRLISIKGRNKEYQVVERNFNKLQDDIIHLLDMEKINGSQVNYDHNQSIDFSGLVAERMELFEEPARVRKIGLIGSIEPGLFTKIDPFAAERVVNNLIDNAVKYSRENGLIEISVESDTDHVRLSVKDNGIGIPEHDQERIFEPYYRIPENKENMQGLGLGLSIAKKIIEEVNGSITVESRLNEGSRFSVILQRDCAAHAPITTDCFPLPNGNDDLRTSEKTSTTVSPGKPVILLIDDNKELLAFLYENLSVTYSVHYALNGKEALCKLDRMPLPDIIVSDIMMDVMDGYEFLEKVSASDDFKEIPFIFLTAKTPIHEQLKGFAHGAIDYICKPFHIDLLSEKIGSILKMKSGQRESDIREIEKKLSKLLRENSSVNTGKLAIDKNFDIFGLTSREKDIGIKLLAGLENKEIASALDISSNTVKQHVNNIYKKCGVQNRVEFANLVKKND
jgi:signal transduction histidine kinase/DNA-binding NarL/FixJ family response regulator